MLVVVQYLDLDAECFFQAALYRIDRAVADALEGFLHAVIGIGNLGKGCKLAVCRLGIGDLALAEVDRFFLVQVILAELFHDLLRSNLTLLLGNLLDDIREFFVHALRQLEAVEGIHNEGYATLSGLAVDADDRLVLSADIGRIDRKVRNLPVLAVSLMESL